MNLIAIAAPVADTDWGHMGEWSAASWLAMIAFWTLVIVVLVWLVRELAGPRRDGPSSATQILERRLATGEISVDEYRERSAALEDSPKQASQSTNLELEKKGILRWKL